MPEMPGQVPERISISEQPRSAVTGQDVASPYEQLGNALDKSGHALEDISTEMATQAGYKAVTRDANGKVQVEPAAYLGPAAIAYRRAVSVAYATEMDGAAKRKDIELRKQYRDQPECYQQAAENYRRGIQADAEKVVGPEAANAIGRMVEQTTTSTYRGLLNEQERLELQRSLGVIDSGIASAEDDASALSRGGAPFDRGPLKDAIDKAEMLRAEKTKNPRLAYTPEQAKLDQDHFLGQLGAQRFIYQTDQVYKSGWDPLTGKTPDTPPDAATRAQQALAFAKGILTNPQLKLTEPQRLGYYHQAEAEIRANEAERRSDVNEMAVAERDLQTSVALGIPLDIARVQQIEDGYNKLGAYARADALLAWVARAPHVNKFGLQSMPDQTNQLNQLGQSLVAPGYTGRVIQIESGGDPYNVTGSNRGLGQFGPEEERRYGITSANYTDRAVQERALQMEAAENMPRLANVLGRPPTPAELYITHQQGQAGGPALLANPDKPAWEVLRPFYGSDRMAKLAISGNIPQGPLRGVPVENITAGQFTSTWSNFFNRGGNGAVPAGGSLTPGVSVGAGLSAPGALPLAAPPAGVSPSVAQAYHMQLARNLDSQEMKTWNEAWEEWKKDGTRPSDEKWKELEDAAKASGNDVLLGTMAKARNIIDGVQQVAQGPLAGQDAALADLRQRLAAGVPVPGGAEFLAEATKRNEQIRKGLAEDAPATVAANFPDRKGVRVPPPLNLANDQELMAGLQERTKLATFAAQVWQVPTPSALGKGDLAAISAVLKQGTIQDKIRILGAITHGITDRNVRNATLTALGEKGTGESEALLAGDMMGRAPAVSESILRGQDALAVDKRYGPEATGEELHWNQELDKRLPATAFSVEGRTKPGGSYDMFAKSVKAVYADISQRMGDTSGVVKPQRLQDAITMVTGGVLTHNGAPLIAPVYGMSQSDFDRTLFGVTDKDLEGVTTQNGQPLTKEYLRSTAQLESRSDGTYRVLLGRDPMKPVYAYIRQAGVPIQPRPFVLDLRNRPMAPFFVPGLEESQYRTGP